MPYGVESLVNAGQKIIFHHLVSRKTVVFPAFVTQFEDQFTSEWNEEYAFGRMDPISTFKRTGRKINLAWQIVAGTIEDAQRNLGRISTLVKMLYPSYSASNSQNASSTHMSGPPLIRIKFMNLIQDISNGQELLGYVGGFSNSPILESGFIESGPGRLYPKAYDMSCTFTVLHTHRVGWYETENGLSFSDQAGNRGSQYPYGSVDPSYNETRKDASEPTTVHEDLAGGYSSLDYEGDADFVGFESLPGGHSNFSELNEEEAADNFGVASGDFPESIQSEVSDVEESVSTSEILK